MPTYDIVGHPKETKYGFNTSLRKEKIKKQILTEWVINSFDFPMNVLMNIQGYDGITDMLKRGQYALSLSALEGATHETGQLPISDYACPGTLL